MTFIESQLKFVNNDLKRVLGVEWDTQSDELVFHFSSLIKLARSLETTKRNVLRITASFYDPLGLISPVTARVKTIFQLLCKDKLDWDEKVPLEIEIIWREFLINLEKWNCLKIKRFAFYEITPGADCNFVCTFLYSRFDFKYDLPWLQAFKKIYFPSLVHGHLAAIMDKIC